MAKIRQAIYWLRQGKKVCRPDWKKDSYWTLGADEMIMFGNEDGESKAILHLRQLEAIDWKVFEKDLTMNHKKVKDLINDLTIIDSIGEEISPKALIRYLKN